MTNKHIALLLSPSLFFVVVAIASFFTSNMIRQRTGDNGGQRKFDVFVANVKSGKWQLTTDRWLEGMRRERATAEAYRKAGASTVELMQDFVWGSLAGILLQTCVVFSLRKRLIER